MIIGGGNRTFAPNRQPPSKYVTVLKDFRNKTTIIKIITPVLSYSQVFYYRCFNCISIITLKYIYYFEACF